MVTVACGRSAGTHVLHCLPKLLNYYMRCGYETWLMLVQPSSHMVAMEADICAEAGEGSAMHTETTRWNNLNSEFANVFKLPGMST